MNKDEIATRKRRKKKQPTPEEFFNARTLIYGVNEFNYCRLQDELVSYIRVN